MLTGPEGALWRHYERMHEAAFHRAYEALPMGAEEATEESAPAPAAPNEATEIEAGAAAEPPSDPAPNEATAGPKSEGFDGPNASGALAGPDFVAFGSPASALVPGSGALGGGAWVVSPVS